MACRARTLLRGTGVLLVGVVAVVAAFAFVGRGEPSPLASDSGNEPDVGSRLVGSVAELDPGQSDPRERAAVRAGATTDQDVPPAVVGVPWVVAIVDTAGRAVQGAHVTLFDAAGRSVTHATTAAEGRVRTGRTADPDAGRGWTIVASVPGRRVESPPVPASRSGVTTTNVGDMGTLRIVCDGTEAIVQVAEDRADEAHGPVEVRREAKATDVPVAAGAVPFVVTARAFGWTVRERVVGPRGQGDVVEVQLDLQACEVTGRLVAEDIADFPTRVTLTGRYSGTSFQLGVAEDGAFSLQVPRGQATTLSFLRGYESATCDVPALLAGPHDVGRVVFAPRPRLGMLEVRDHRGTVMIDLARVVRVTMADGRQAPGELVGLRPILGVGIEVLGAHGVTSTTLALGLRDSFCEPATIEIQGGGVFRAQLIDGSRVVVELVEPGATGLRGLRLRNTTTQQVCDHGNARLDAATGSQVFEFRGLRPGRYEVVAEGADLVGGILEVPSGSEQEITVSARPR